MATLCPCVLFGQNAEKAGEGSCITFTLLYLTSACCCTIAGYLRGKIQLRLGYMDSGARAGPAWGPARPLTTSSRRAQGSAPTAASTAAAARVPCRRRRGR